MEVILTEDELREKCAEWQAILRLQDWDIQVTIERASSFKIPGNEGECEWNIQYKTALIRILDPVDFPPYSKWPYDMEETLVHELLHLHFVPFDNFERETHEKNAVEQAINLITCALLRLKRNTRKEVAQ